MKLERKFEPINEQHQPLLAALALEGIDTTPCIGGAERLVGYGETKHGYGPVCVLDLIQTPYVAEPHIIWFPWVSRKQKISHFKWAMQYMSGSREVLLNVEKQHTQFFDHFARQGLLRKVGHINNLPLVDEIHIYQVKRRPT